MKVYQRIAQIADAYHRSVERGNQEWADKHEETLGKLADDYLPHGPGFDAGTAIDLAKSSVKKVVLTTSYHHMDENGFYAGWTDHTVTVLPNLAFEFDLRISGRDRNGWKDYAYEVFYNDLTAELKEDVCAPLP